MRDTSRLCRWYCNTAAAASGSRAQLVKLASQPALGCVLLTAPPRLGGGAQLVSLLHLRRKLGGAALLLQRTPLSLGALLGRVMAVPPE